MKCLINRSSSLPVLVFVICCSFQLISAQQLSPGEKLLRDDYLLGDRELVVLDGKPLIEQKNASLRSRAYYFSQAMMTPFEFEWDWSLMSVLQGMQKENPNDPWTLVARAANVPGTAERAALCNKAIAASPDHDVLVLCADMMGHAVAARYPGADADDLTAFIDKHGDRLETSADGLCVKAMATLLLAIKRNDSRGRETAFGLANRALTIDPRHERTLLMKAQYMVGQKQYKEVLDMLGPILSTGVRSALIHRPYNNSVNQLDLPKEEKAKLIEADIMRLLDNRLPGKLLLSDLSDILGSNSKEAAKRIAEAVIKRYPNTYGSEWATVQVITAKPDVSKSDPEAADATRRDVANELIAYLERSTPGAKAGNIAALAGVRSASDQLDELLLWSPSPDGIGSEQLWRAFNAAWHNFDRWQFANELLKRRVHIPEIQQTARETIELLTVKTKSNSDEWRLVRNGEDLKEDAWTDLSHWYDVAGYAELRLGNLKAAEGNLVLAEKLNTGRNIPLNLHLAELSTARKEYDKAEARLNTVLNMGWGTESEHPALAGFRSLYMAQHKNAAGLDSYMASVLEKDRARRKIAVIRSRIPDPKPHAEFALQTLDGRTVGSSDLKGKVAIINFWGVWCGPCVREMPQLQKLYETYKNDPRVAILTIDSGDGPAKIRAYLEKNRYTFPVLLEGNYIPVADIRGFPTTWFIGPDGRIAFIKVGTTSDLEAEFSWRIDALLTSQK